MISESMKTFWVLTVFLVLFVRNSAVSANAIHGGKSWAWIWGTQATTLGDYQTIGFFNDGAAPAARHLAAAVMDVNGTVWLQGGTTSMDGGSFGDLWAWNGRQWKLVMGTNFCGTRPVLEGDALSPGATVLSTVWPDPNGGFHLFGGNGFTSNSSGTFAPPRHRPRFIGCCCADGLVVCRLRASFGPLAVQHDQMEDHILQRRAGGVR